MYHLCYAFKDAGIMDWQVPWQEEATQDRERERRASQTGEEPMKCTATLILKAYSTIFRHQF